MFLSNYFISNSVRACLGKFVFHTQVCKIFECRVQPKYATVALVRYNNTQTKSFCYDLSTKLDLDSDVLMNSFRSCQNLDKFSSHQWVQCFKVLGDNGFSPSDILYMVTKHPPLLQMKENNVNFVINVWRTTNMGEKYILSLLKYCPDFVTLPTKNISTRVPVLKSLGNWKSIVDLLKGAPNIMYENWNDIMKKLLFLEDEMKVSKNHIGKCYALSNSLLFLKTRFIFLMRCGKYSVRKKEDCIVIKNPSLKNIVSFSDEEFATQLAGVSLEEYEVFQDLYFLEVEESNINEVSDSDSESDSE